MRLQGRTMTKTMGKDKNQNLKKHTRNTHNDKNGNANKGKIKTMHQNKHQSGCKSMNLNRNTIGTTNKKTGTSANVIQAYESEREQRTDRATEDIRDSNT